MKDYRTRTQAKKNIFHSWVFLVGLFLLLALFMRSAAASFDKKRQADRERERYEEQLRILQEKKEDLSDTINNLQTPRGREGEFRKRFNVVKEGEKMIRIIEE